MIFEWSQKTASSSAEDTSQGKDLWNSLFIQTGFSLKQSRERNPQIPGQTWKDGSPTASRGNANWTGTRYWHECCEQSAWAGHCLTHLLSGHLCLLSSSLLCITSLETSKLGIPHPQAGTKWQPGRQMEKFITVTFCKPILWHPYSVSGVASGTYLEFENSSSKKQSPEVRHRQCAGTEKCLLPFAHQ